MYEFFSYSLYGSGAPFCFSGGDKNRQKELKDRERRSFAGKQSFVADKTSGALRGRKVDRYRGQQETRRGGSGRPACGAAAKGRLPWDYATLYFTKKSAHERLKHVRKK